MTFAYFTLKTRITQLVFTIFTANSFQNIVRGKKVLPQNCVFYRTEIHGTVLEQ